jgi:hypothetical protein
MKYNGGFIFIFFYNFSGQDKNLNPTLKREKNLKSIGTLPTNTDISCQPLFYAKMYSSFVLVLWVRFTQTQVTD